jgi:hypothetical protein
LGVAWCTLLDAYAVASSGKSPPWTATLLQPFRSLQHPRRSATRWLLASRLSRCVALLSCACMPQSCSSSFLPVRSHMFATILGHACKYMRARTHAQTHALTHACSRSRTRTRTSHTHLFQVLNKNRYVGRSFIEPNTFLRQSAVLRKFSPLTDNIDGKRVSQVNKPTRTCTCLFSLLILRLLSQILRLLSQTNPHLHLLVFIVDSTIVFFENR